MIYIKEIEKVLWFETPLGIGQALFLIDYGCHENTIWVLAMRNDGKIKHFNSNQISLTTNYTLEFNL